MSGNIPQLAQFLNKIDKSSVTTESQISSILIEILPWPWALFTFLIISNYFKNISFIKLNCC